MVEGLVIGIDKRDIASIEQAFQKAPRTMNLFVNRTLKEDVERRMRAKLQTNPPPPRYPLKWKSERQRKYVMAKLRAENNLPYQRTGALIAAWEFNANTSEVGGLIEIVNPSPVARYVFGADRQPMFPHWYDADRILLEEQQYVTEVLEDTWFLINSREFA